MVNSWLSSSFPRSLFSTQVGLMVRNPSKYPKSKQEKMERKTLSPGWGKKKVYFHFRCLSRAFSQLNVWCIYRTQGECLRVTGSGAAFWAIKKLRIMQEKVDGRGQEKAKNSRTQEALSFMLPRPSHPPGLVTSNQGL